ncbi:OX-2 membrane glycoprotein-like isoform X1 [Loxodonta africana]|uniref:OX-2 membrane glycoprotein-like isoform X1 n=2 Tax=Loxodonta africana TaxID=9785 RepID=UPI000C812BF9|nr:OX-2 membrane glycoprotein-like isoform X1 [Loxodonta africana]XP_023407593.1 OX-2 membrane glycoprotein-like isoform X1 [Loxodonta africana]
MLVKILSSSSMGLSLHLILQLLMLFTWVQGLDSVYRLKHRHNVTAVLGKNVTMFCNLTTSENVLQITWQKIQGSLAQNIATYSSRLGTNILPPYLDRLHIEPNSSFITIHEVTLEDEACYSCLFNVFPLGSRERQICLNILTVSELRAVLQSNPDSEGFLTVIYSAMGKPAPQISLSPSQVLMHPSKEYRAQNPNGTITVTKMDNISLEAVWSLGQQNVIVRMDHPLRQEEKIIPLSLKQECISWSSYISKSIVLALMSSLSTIALIVILYTVPRKKKSKETLHPTPELRRLHLETVGDGLPPTHT